MFENTIFFLGKKNKKLEKKLTEKFEKVLFVKEVSTIEEIKKEEKKNYDVVLIKNENVKMLRRMIEKAANYFDVFVLGVNDQVNRIALEHRKVKALVSPEYGRKHDYIDYRNSGLNHVLCKIANNNNKTIIENFSDFLEKDNKEKATLLGRILQNARLCRKYKVNFTVGLFVSDETSLRPHDLKYFQRILNY